VARRHEVSSGPRSAGSGGWKPLSNSAIESTTQAAGSSSGSETSGVELASNRHSEVMPHYQGISAALDRLMRRLDAETQRAVTDVLDELSAAFEAESVRLRIDVRKGGTGRRP
jgi:hypothetical protein